MRNDDGPGPGGTIAREPDRLESWKEVASFLGRGITTVQRWEREEGLPIHRHVHAAKGSIYAFRSEIDAWRAARSGLTAAEYAGHGAERLEASSGEAGGGIRALGSAGPHGPPVAPLHAGRGRIGRVLVPAAVLTGGIVLVLMTLAVSRDGHPPAAPERLVRPFTQEAGQEGFPAFSRDGREVTYAWYPRDEPPGFFVRPTAGGPARRLTTRLPGSGWEGHAAWSPDGRLFAYQREERPNEFGIILFSPADGRERRLASSLGVGLAWTPDGRELAISDREAAGEPFSILRILATAGERTARLTVPPPGSHGDLYPTYSPDRRWIAFVRYTTPSSADVYVAPAEGGEPRRLTFDEHGTEGVAWAADSRALVFASYRRGNASLWAVPLEASSPGDVRLVAASEGSARFPAIASPGAGAPSHIVYEFQVFDVNVWGIERAAHSAETTSAVVAESSGWDNHPALSPDGLHVAFTSNRSGSAEIWVADAGGGHPRQVTFRAGPLCLWPRWAPDGRRIAFVSATGSNRDIYVVSAAGDGPRRLTSEPSDEGFPSWSRDGRFVYFRSTRGGVSQIWKMPSEGGHAVLVTKGEGTQAFESADGRSVLFVRSSALPGLWRVPAEGGNEELLADGVREGLWAPVDTGFCFVDPPGPEPGARLTVSCYDEQTRRTTRVAKLSADNGRLKDGFAASGDGRRFLWSQVDTMRNDLMIIGPLPADSVRAGLIAR